MNKYSIESKLQFIIYSILGIIIFFVPVTIGGKSTIPLDHIVTYILKIPYFQPVYGALFVILGASCRLSTRRGIRIRQQLCSLC